MSTLTIDCDDNNDISLKDGRNVVIITGSAACAQNLLQKSLMRLGEDQYDTSDGVDYFGAIFTPQPNYDDARASITRNLLECPDVLSIQTLTITIEFDVFIYVAKVNTIYGPVEIENTQRSRS